MATSRDELKSYFKQFSTPTESQFAKLIDSALNLKDDGLEKSTGTPLKITAGAGNALQRVVEFYKEATDSAPAWTLQMKALKPSEANGLAIVKGKDETPVLFIDGTNSESRLNINADIYALKSSIYFTDTEHNHTGIGNTLGYAAIENAKNHNALVILGRTQDSNNGKRAVQIWDILEVKNGPIIPEKNIGIKFGNSVIMEDSGGVLHINNRGALDINVADQINIMAAKTKIGGFDFKNICITGNDFKIEAINSVKIQVGEKVIMNEVANNSDEREKFNIQPLQYGLKDICLLDPVSYHWKNRPNPKRSIGLIAQKVDAVIQEATHFDKNSSSGHGWCISYNSLIPVLINAIKELDQKVKDLQGQK